MILDRQTDDKYIKQKLYNIHHFKRYHTPGARQ